MVSWATFAVDEPAMAAAGRRLLDADGIAIGFLATVGRNGRPHLAPVCPIAAGPDLYLSVGAHTAKLRHLAADDRYALHAFLGPEDEEFMFGGRAIRVDSASTRALVHGAIKFGSFDRSDPIVRLEIEWAARGCWQQPGTPASRRVVRRWPRARATTG